MPVPRVPLAEIPPESGERLAAWGGQTTNLYRVLANQPRILDAWVDFLWSLRKGAVVSRDIRELMILRIAQLVGSRYVWRQHMLFARQLGMMPSKLAGLGRWRSSSLFTPAERAALSCSEAIAGGRVSARADGQLRLYFSDAERIELAATAAAYVMVARFIDAMRVPVDN